MLQKYLWCLFKQFCDAKGLDVTNTSIMDSATFTEWVVQRQVLLFKYKGYLENLGFDYPIEDVLEIGKGQYDSLSSTGISIVSPFAETIGKSNSMLYVDKGIPLILQSSGIILPMEHTLLSYNPYFESEILNWYLIHNMGESNISIGMFGEIGDDDASRKVKLLQSLSKQMTDDYSFVYDTNEENYFCALNSQRNIKRKVLIR